MYFFVQTSTNVFVGYTNAALMRFVTIPKGHTIAHANMDSREMDENVKVVVWSINNYVMKKIKFIFANYPQRDSNLHLDPLSKKTYSETERGQRYMSETTLKNFLLEHQSVFASIEINLLIIVCWFHPSFVAGQTVVWLQKPIWCSQQQILMLCNSNTNIK